MKPAHWARVTKQLAAKFSIPFKDAKKVYDKLQTTEGRKPSLRMVSGLPAKLPGKLKGRKTEKAEEKAPLVKQKTVKTEKIAPKQLDLGLPPNVRLAPPPRKGEPVPVPTRQYARNKFEQILKDQGLPVAALGRSPIGKVIAQNWRNEKLQKRIAKELAAAYKQVDKYGAARRTTLDKLEKLIGKLETTGERKLWSSIFANMYRSDKPKK